MIVSHRHKFIFIKTAKTTGTSVEIALSKFCGPEDIITPISGKDETKRRELGYLGPQNLRIPLLRYSKSDLLHLMLKRKRVQYYNHASAAFIKRHIPAEAWTSYYKFCFERNPWDKAVSWYYWASRNGPRPSVSEFIDSGKMNRVRARGFGLYTINAEVVVDKVYRYEEIESAMADIADRLMLGEVPTLPLAKTGYRKDTQHYSSLLNEADRQKISQLFAPEIALFGYEC